MIWGAVGHPRAERPTCVDHFTGGRYEGRMDNAQPTEHARRAAAMLPDAPDGPATKRDAADKGVLWFSIAVMIGAPIAGLVALALLPQGWLAILVGIPLWFAVRWIFFRMRGSETGFVTVDDDGVVHVLSGQFAVKRLQRLFTVGTDRWMRHAWLNGLGLLVVGMGIPIGLAIALDSPVPAAAMLSALCFGALDFMRYIGTMTLARRRQGSRVLDGSALLPALAIYAQAHGWRQAVSGVPADQLAITLAAHPDEVAEANRYATSAAYMTRLAALGGALGGAAGSL